MQHCIYKHNTSLQKQQKEYSGEYKNGSSWLQGGTKWCTRPWVVPEILSGVREDKREPLGKGKCCGSLFFAALALRAGAATASVVTAQNLQVSEILNSAKDGAQKHLTCNKNSTVCWENIYIYCCAQCGFRCCWAVFEPLNCADWRDDV